MAITIAFDVYGTLIDTSGVVAALEKLIGLQSRGFSDLWRAKQLEYSFRRGLMQNYRDFSVCTAQALDYCCRSLRVELSPAERSDLLSGYRYLPAFPDAREALAELSRSECRLFAFSNGLAADVENLLQQAGLSPYLQGVVSCDELRSFKPNPGVYAHFLRRAGCRSGESWLISGNPFDVIGAISAGMQGAWIKRSPEAVFDPWEIEPTQTLSRLTELREALGIQIVEAGRP